MITDTNSSIGMATNILTGLTGGDIILMGIIFFVLIVAVLMMARVKASTSVMIGISIAFMFSIFASGFMVLFWVGVIVALFVLVNGLRKSLTGQN